MTYLTKVENEKIFHFRISVDNKGVEIVEGLFYNWLGKRWIGCGSDKNAEIELQKYVKDKIENGFTITDFIETLENTIDVYDKAKWHYGGDFPKELDDFHGYIHTGMFLGWLIDSDLTSEEFNKNNPTDIQDFKSNNLTGSQIYEKCCDGVLMLEDISELGNRFSLPYFDFTNGQYLKDYENTLAIGLPTLYHVNDTWENYRKIKIVLDQRFSEWNNQNKKSFWDRFK